MLPSIVTFLLVLQLRLDLFGMCLCICVAYFTSSENPYYAELTDVVETLSNDTDRDVQYIVSKHLDEFPR